MATAKDVEGRTAGLRSGEWMGSAEILVTRGYEVIDGEGNQLDRIIALPLTQTLQGIVDGSDASADAVIQFVEASSDKPFKVGGGHEFRFTADDRHTVTHVIDGQKDSIYALKRRGLIGSQYLDLLSGLSSSAEIVVSPRSGRPYLERPNHNVSIVARTQPSSAAARRG